MLFSPERDNKLRRKALELKISVEELLNRIIDEWFNKIEEEKQGD